MHCIEFTTFCYVTITIFSQPSVKCYLDFLQHDTSSCAYDPELVSGMGESRLFPSMTNHPTVKTKQKISMKSDQTMAKQYPTLESFALQVTHSLCFILYLFFSFIIVCSGRFCGLIMCALKFWNSAGKVLITITKLCHFMCTKLWSHMATFNPGVEMYVRETCQNETFETLSGGGGGVAWSHSPNYKENGGGSGILYHLSYSYDQVLDHFLTITNVRKPYACHRKKLTLA